MLPDEDFKRFLRLQLSKYPESLYVQSKLQKLVTFPLKKYRLPQSYKENVITFDPVGPLSTLLPFKAYALEIFNKAQWSSKKRKNCLVIGYRELFEKREKQTYLRWQAGLDLFTDASDQLDNKYEILLPVPIARGGGSSKKGEKSSKKKKEKSDKDGKKKSKKKSKDRKKKKKDKKSKKKSKKKHAKDDAASEPASPALDPVPYSQALPDDLPSALQQKLDKDLIRDLASSKGRASIVLQMNKVDVPTIEEEFLREDIPESEEEFAERTLIRRQSSLIDESRLLSLVTAQRDSEWLSYSSTDSLELQEKDEAEQLLKQREPWMLRGITYESQVLIDGLYWFLLSSKLTGRTSFYTRPDYLENIMIFVVDRGNEFVFLITSTGLWLCFVLIAQAAIDILLVGGSGDYIEREKYALGRYFIPCLYVIGELAVVAVWSVFLLLKYSLRMAHYINVWSTSASEMEGNIASGIVSNTIGNHVFFLIYSLGVTTSFIVGIPRNVRSSMGVLTALLIRNFVPDTLEHSDGFTLTLQIFGLCLHIYVTYCARITTNLVHIMSIILRNAAELWNLKFALRARQVPVGKSGYLRHMRLRHTYSRAWIHHRLLTGLCLELGNVFAAPMALNFLSRLSVVVLCMVSLFKLAYETKPKRAEKEAEPKFQSEQIPTQLEDVVTHLLILIYLALDFVVNATYLDAAGQAFRDGYEFVRRKGFLLCANSRERRLIQSLQWSFSARHANSVNLKGFFPVDKETILSFLAIALLLWSLIIQLQAEAPGVVIVFTPNCSQPPNGNFPHKKDPQGFCRKKVWTVMSDVEPRTNLILQKLNSLTSNLESKERRRKRSAHRLPKTTEISAQFQAILHSKFQDGNCLQPIQNDTDLVRSYYEYFNERCHSPALNATLLVPKLYARGHQLSIRRIIDRGISPFPIPSLFPKDCAGNVIEEEDYDDCGWRKTGVDDKIFAHRGGNNGTVRKVVFHGEDGQEFSCWNLFYALKRCELIRKSRLWDICRVPKDQFYVRLLKKVYARNFTL